MQIHRATTHAIDAGPPEYFTGTVRIERLVDAPAPARVAGARLAFFMGRATIESITAVSSRRPTD